MPIIKLRCAILGLAAAVAYSSCKEAQSRYQETTTISSVTYLASTFKKQFPGATDVVWDSLENMVIVNFYYKDHACEARYTLDGHMTGMTSYIQPEELPKTIGVSVKKRFPDAELAVIQQEITEKDTTYELQVHDVNTYNYMTYSKNGELLKMERDTTSEEELNDQLHEEPIDTTSGI